MMPSPVMERAAASTAISTIDSTLGGDDNGV
jgi:hypothetical protein